VTHVLCTHHHIDHVQHNKVYAERFGCPICGHASEALLFGDLDHELDDGDELVTGGLHIRAMHIPGHTLGQLAYLVNDEIVFTGDTLFRRTIGGTRAPGHTTFEDIQHSILETLMRLPKDTIVYPGHTDPTTIREEWEENPFIRMWRGLDTPGTARCTALGQPATLLLRAVDYDGGHKCQVRFDDGTLDIVPGSRVT
jgi:glyoxylase-like metal-dependent hydrolase (beta-lactamase superfamily II)